MTKLRAVLASLVSFVFFFGTQLANAAQQQGAARTTMQAESPFTDYTAGVVAYVLAIGFLVAFLLIGGMVVMNLRLLSKRPEDRKLARREPSDAEVLKHTLFAEEEPGDSILPAEEDEKRPDRDQAA